MIVKSADVRKAIKAAWPKLKFMVLSDREWWLPEVENVEAMVHEVAVDRMSFIPPLFECEEFSLALVAAIRGRRADLYRAGKLQPERVRNWPLGVVCGTRFQGEDVDHWINVCVTRQGVWLIEPQTGLMWQPEKGEDEIFFLLM